MALTKAAIAESLFEELGLNKREAKELVEQFFEEIRVALENGYQVLSLWRLAQQESPLKPKQIYSMVKPFRLISLLKVGANISNIKIPLC